MEKQPNSRMCFVCGLENPIGLRLAFYTDEMGRCITHFQPEESHQGYPGHLHGGIISTLLDECMGRVLLSGGKDLFAFTGRLDIKFGNPVPLDQELTIVGEMVKGRSRAYEARGEIRLPDGTVLVEGKGLYVRVPDGMIEEAKAGLGFWQVVSD